MAISKETERKLDEINGDIMDIIDRLEEISEDEETLSRRINQIIDALSNACDMFDELE